MSERSIARFISVSLVPIICSLLFISYLVEYFVKGGIVYARPVMNAFSRAASWALFMSFILLNKSIYESMRRREKWWWHQFFFFIAVIIGASVFLVYPTIFNQLFYAVGTAGLGAISCLSAFAFITGLMRGFAVRNAMNVWVIIWIIAGIIPYTPFADVLGKMVYDACMWSITTLLAGSAASQTYIRDIATVALGARAILLVERYKPRLVSRG